MARGQSKLPRIMAALLLALGCAPCFVSPSSAREEPPQPMSVGRRSVALATLLGPVLSGQEAAWALRKCRPDEPQASIVAKSCTTPIDFDPKTCGKKADGEVRSLCLGLEEKLVEKCSREIGSRDADAYRRCSECQERLLQGLRCIPKPAEGGYR
eukprot:TRINITY_DN49638_c0_g1_i1.p2 TRINITY_DN49638_c0_g1~~TRINITY_DN49638_c0_g1_i1.p2  ORF type:complete len:155 (+),score=29.79 TRINITY_DN49638_c0_g1_i1:53-517(+)